MDCSTPGLPVLHQLPELPQTHVHRVGDAIQPSHLCCPLLLPSIFPSIRVFSSKSVLHIRWPKYWSFSFSISLSNEHQDWFPLGWTGWISLQSKGLSRVFSNTTVQKHQFFSTQLSCCGQIQRTTRPLNLLTFSGQHRGSFCVPEKWHLGTSRCYQACIANRLGQPRSSEPWAPIRMLGRRCQGPASYAPTWVDMREWDVCSQTWEAEPEGSTAGGQACSHSS